MDSSMEPGTSKSTRTSAEVDAEYKGRVPKFDEKIDACHTDDLLGIKMKRKPLLVSVIVFRTLYCVDNLS